MTAVVHIVCCRPRRALCQAPVHGIERDALDDDCCGACVEADELGYPCGALLCRLRQWWRGRWAS